LMLHRTRDLLMRQRTQLINALRAHMAELGIVAAQGNAGLKELLKVIASEQDARLPVDAHASLVVLAAPRRHFRNADGVAEEPGLEQFADAVYRRNGGRVLHVSAGGGDRKAAPRPILIPHSVRDRVCNFEEAFSLMRLAKPPVELYLIDGVDHFVFVDPDRRVAVILRDWLDRFFPVKPGTSGETE